ncbi:MAG: endolytic transglycosylase MltG [Bacteroidia bacterium]|nr:endolytic transglycosylase MltG [Bacteroidia bacterium]
MKKKLLLLIVILVLIASFFAFRFYSYIYNDNVKVDVSSTIFLPTKVTFEDLVDTLNSKDILIDSRLFYWVADKMKFRTPKPGKYIIEPGWNNHELISHLRSGSQEPVQVTFNNIRKIENLAAVFAEKLEGDSIQFVKAFTEFSLLSELGLTKENIISLFIPNTYEFYWNTSPAKVMNKMKQEHDKFWAESRREKLNNLIFSKQEVYTLASIVQKETNRNSEKPMIAGVYINRLKRGIPLQADPTVVFAVGDFGIRRVLNKHIAVDSPFNTYKNNGLPPGPICMPDISSIDAVLDYEKHRFLYFCASPSENGGHVFAKTLTEHNKNANIYRRWLNQRKIFK